jgi:hypothetical protein
MARTSIVPRSLARPPPSCRHVRAAGERLDVQRPRVLPVDPVADPAQPREVAQMLLRGGSAAHTQDRTSRRDPAGVREPVRDDALTDFPAIWFTCIGDCLLSAVTH